MHWHPYYTFTNGGAIPPTPPSTPTPSGVRKGRKRELIVRLSDVKSRTDTAEFLKEQLRLRHPNSAFQPEPAQPAKFKLSKADQARQAKLSHDAMVAMQIEADNEQRRILQAKNDEIIKLIILASL